MSLLNSSATFSVFYLPVRQVDRFDLHRLCAGEPATSGAAAVAWSSMEPTISVHRPRLRVPAPPAWRVIYLYPFSVSKQRKVSCHQWPPLSHRHSQDMGDLDAN